MTVSAVTTFGPDEGVVWGFTPAGRHEALAGRLGLDVVDHETAAQKDSILLLSNRYAVEAVFLKALAKGDKKIVLSDEGDIVAAKIAGKALSEILDGRLPDATPQVPLNDMRDLYQDELRKKGIVPAWDIKKQSRRTVEWGLYIGAYKGVTDFVTKYLWPWPAFYLTQFCRAFSISPNMVTTISLVLVLLAMWLFWTGQFAWGVIAGWAMCLLDTVDGKLARVTLRSSKWGEAYDHGIDLIHPPFWYWAWVEGLYVLGLVPNTTWANTMLAIMIGGYIVGRLMEGVFLLVARIELWTWTRLDSFIRLIVARRNPNLFILTVFLLIGDLATGVYAVAVWTVFSVFYQVLRISTALAMRLAGRPLVSWMQA